MASTGDRLRASTADWEEFSKLAGGNVGPGESAGIDYHVFVSDRFAFEEILQNFERAGSLYRYEEFRSPGG
ncbi:hypothetical protein [Rhizobium sp. BK251]|uniref:hypothetical protein n=1 Tax=Rhizobium sp. BK251 TaxID=2512125 RepID=UPI0010DDDBF9|nr:hypothetical protein [Rhizobium sp. BK251]TCL62923.1 hypothetical protein EV286_11829 [Rhizobium sp. BK251]